MGGCVSGPPGRYHMIGTLGNGSVGLVHDAKDTRLARPVTLRILTSTHSKDDSRFCDRP